MIKHGALALHAVSYLLRHGIIANRVQSPHGVLAATVRELLQASHFLPGTQR